MRVFRLVVTVASLPVAAVAAVRAAVAVPRGAREHPSSQELRRLLDRGFTVTGYRNAFHPRSVQVSLQRGEETRTVTSSDLAFAAYAARTVPRAVTQALYRDQRRVLNAG